MQQGAGLRLAALHRAVARAIRLCMAVDCFQKVSGKQIVGITALLPLLMSAMADLA